MIEPLLQDDAFLADVRSAPREADRARIWWLGQSGFLVGYQGAFLLMDPYLSDSLTRKYANSDKPHVRMTARVVDPARLNFINSVTASHQHTDHLDPETLGALRQANPGLRFVCPAAHRQVAAERSGLPADRLDPLDAGDGCAVGPFQIRAVPAAHEAVDLDSAGRHVYLGLVVRFGPFAIYHSGDTVRFPGLEAAVGGRIDAALLPINGREPQRRVAGNLTGREAAQLAFDLEAGVVVPCHYEMFEFNTASPADFEAECRRLGQSFATLRAGEGRTWCAR